MSKKNSKKETVEQKQASRRAREAEQRAQGSVGGGQRIRGKDLFCPGEKHPLILQAVIDEGQMLGKIQYAFFLQILFIRAEFLGTCVNDEHQIRWEVLEKLQKTLLIRIGKLCRG